MTAQLSTRSTHDAPGADPLPSRTLCLGLMGVALAALVVLGALLVPWSWVPGGHLVKVPADEVFTPAQLARGDTYSSLQRHLGWASLAVSLVVALGLGLTSLGSGLVRRLPGPWWVRALLGTLLLTAVGTLVTLPLALRSRQHALDYGLTNQALSGWLRDQGVSLLVNTVFAGVMVLLIIGTARRSPRRWPLWTGLAGALLTVLGSWVYPVVVEPLFNQFTPLAAGPLRTEILALARKEHVPVSDVLVADASRRTTTLNAYVSGFGSTRRVVLYDNLVSSVPRRQTLSVVAHELGHARHHDVLLGTVLGAGGVLFGSGLLGLVLSRRRLLERAGCRGAWAAGGSGPAAGARGRRHAAGQPGAEHRQPGDRGARGPGRPGGDLGPHGVRAGAASARAALAERGVPTRLEPVLVRLAPDDPGAHRDLPGAGQRGPLRC